MRSFACTSFDSLSFRRLCRSTLNRKPYFYIEKEKCLCSVSPTYFVLKRVRLDVGVIKCQLEREQLLVETRARVLGTRVHEASSGEPGEQSAHETGGDEETRGGGEAAERCVVEQHELEILGQEADERRVVGLDLCGEKLLERTQIGAVLDRSMIVWCQQHPDAIRVVVVGQRIVLVASMMLLLLLLI